MRLCVCCTNFIVQICVSTQGVVLGVFYIFIMIPKYEHETFGAELSCQI